MTSTIREYVAHQEGLILRLLLGTFVVLFLGILVAVYVVAKEANPVLLDEHGRPITTEHR